jgi:hypothetical protein
MELINSTPYPDRFLRRMVSWCCRVLELPVSKVRKIRFRNREDGFTSGYCYDTSGEIVVSVGVPRYQPESPLLREPGLVFRSERGSYPDPTVRILVGPPEKLVQEHHRDLVRVTAHELAHRMLWLEGSRTRFSRRYNRARRGSSEQQTIWFENMVLEKFQAKKDELLAAWLREPERAVARAAVSKDPNREKLEKARGDLARWQRKLKLAQTKVRKYKGRVTYYERRVGE